MSNNSNGQSSRSRIRAIGPRRPLPSGKMPGKTKPSGSFRTITEVSDRLNNMIPTTVIHRTPITGSTDGTGIPSFDATGAPFTAIDIDWLVGEINKRTDVNYFTNRKMFDGDHWLEGDGWTGPRPDIIITSGTNDYGIVMDQIRRAFVSKNCIKEVTLRHTNGIVGREPSWYLTTKTEAQAPKLRNPNHPSNIDTMAATAVSNGQPAPVAPADANAPSSATDPNAANPPDPTKAAAPGGQNATPSGSASSGPVLPAPVAPIPPVPVPLDPGSLLIAEAETALTEWWDKRKMHKLFRKFIVTALLGGRATLRVYVPSGMLDPSGTLNTHGDIAKALDRIYMHSPNMDEATIVTNEHTQQEMGIYVHTDEDDNQHAEIVYVVTEAKSNVVSSSAAPDNANVGDNNTNSAISTGVKGEAKFTIIQEVVTGDGNDLLAMTDAAGSTGVVDGNVFTDQVRLPLGGKLTIFELEIPTLITEQVRKLNMAINKTLTMEDENINLAGFLERTILNGQLPGHYEDDPTRKGKQTFVRDKYETGGGAINSIIGTPMIGPNGEFLGLATPSINFREPTTPKTFDESKMSFYRALLEEVDQVHYLLSGDQYASGESRKQARADFEASLRSSRGAINEAVRWTIETPLALAAWIAGEPDKYTDLRAVGDARIDPGPATTDHIRSAIELNAANGLSQQSMMVWSGVDDVDAEKRLIAKERAEGILNPVPGGITVGIATGKPSGKLTPESLNIANGVGAGVTKPPSAAASGGAKASTNGRPIGG